MQEFTLSHVGLMVGAIAFAAGLAVALVAWVLTHSFSKTPEENREYKDPAPLGFRLIWWPVQWLSHHVDPWIRSKSRTALLARLRQADLDYAINPAQFVASRFLGAMIAAGIVWWVIGTFESGLAGDGSTRSAVDVQAALAGALFGWAYPAIWLRDRLAARRRELLKTLPFFLDIVTLCVEAGLNMQGALEQAVSKGPKGALREALQRVIRDIRSGKARAVAMRDMAERLQEPGISNFTTAVIQAERMGMNLGPILRAQADQRRSERFLRAEKLAMEAPVKMLLPLIAFIFPCTFVVLFFPIVMKLMHSGL